MHIPRKRFGQHFLSDQAYIHQIVSALHPQITEHLIEIGPGQGALTLPVMKIVGHLEAVELDRDLIPELKQRTCRYGELEIYSADALNFDFASIKKDERLLRIFGNLPYNISTPLIFHLLSFASIIKDMLFMLQKEVAERIAAKPGSDAYGRLSVMTQYYCQAEILFDVPPTAFFPPPQVDSSIIRLIPYESSPYHVADFALFEKVVKESFGQRRKTLRNSLKKLMTDDIWSTINVSSEERPENLSVEEFVIISNALSKVKAN